MSSEKTELEQMIDNFVAENEREDELKKMGKKPEPKKDKELKIKKVLVTGSSGYVGNFLLRTIAGEYRELDCIGMSRSGKVRKGEHETHQLSNVRYVAGDVTKPETFENLLADVDAVVHAVGGLFPSKKPGRSL